MSKNELKPNFEHPIDPVPEEFLPMALVFFLSQHIDNPCQTGVEPGVFQNIRDFYIREAERLMPKIEKENSSAAAVLLEKIQEYKK